MVKNLEQAINNYVTELNAFREWFDDRTKTFGSNDSFHYWDTSDFVLLNSKSKALEQIEKVLGLTKLEIEEYEKKAGIKNYK
jgi:hypothetical protein